MDMDRLLMINSLSCCHKVAVVKEQVAGFLLAMREKTPYQNDNYAWFASRCQKFIYVDRIVVSPVFAGIKIGSSLYEDLFTYALGQKVKTVVCECNIEPLNVASKAFHDRFGFKEVATQRVADGSKVVSLQVAKV